MVVETYSKTDETEAHADLRQDLFGWREEIRRSFNCRYCICNSFPEKAVVSGER